MDVDENEDLFGDEEEDVASDGGRALSDRELDSGDDEGRRDRVEDTKDEDDSALREIRTQDILLARGRVPKPSNGEVRHNTPDLRTRALIADILVGHPSNPSFPRYRSWSIRT